LETLDKLNVEENYLPEQIFNTDDTSLLSKRMPERTFSHREARSMPGFKVCVSTLFDIRTTMHFSERIPVVKRCMTVLLYYLTTFQLRELSSRAMARDVEESSHRTVSNGIHFMVLK
jgi:hypothetical protein